MWDRKIFFSNYREICNNHPTESLALYQKVYTQIILLKILNEDITHVLHKYNIKYNNYKHTLVKEFFQTALMN